MNLTIISSVVWSGSPINNSSTLLLAEGRNIDDHQVMATVYLNAIKSTLLEHFPNLSDLDAEALSWGGLYRTQAWQSFQQNVLGRTLDIQNVNKKHKRGDSGTPCEPPPPPPPPPSGGDIQ
ncbi:MAG: hypothetical protein HEQ40_11010 [Lacibacter sp.]